MKYLRFCLLAGLTGLLVASSIGAKDKVDKDKAVKDKVEKDKGSQVKELIVGKWHLKDEKQKGVTFEFTKDGKLSVEMKFGDFQRKANGNYKLLDDKTLEVTMKGPMGTSKTGKMDIKTLTKDTLIMVDPKGKGKPIELKKM